MGFYHVGLAGLELLTPKCWIVGLRHSSPASATKSSSASSATTSASKATSASTTTPEATFTLRFGPVQGNFISINFTVFHRLLGSFGILLTVEVYKAKPRTPNEIAHYKKHLLHMSQFNFIAKDFQTKSNLITFLFLFFLLVLIIFIILIIIILFIIIILVLIILFFIFILSYILGFHRNRNSFCSFLSFGWRRQPRPLKRRRGHVGVPGRPPRARNTAAEPPSGAHNVSACQARAETSRVQPGLRLGPIPPFPTPTHRSLWRFRDPRGAAHVAGRAPGHVRQESDSSSYTSQEFGLISSPRGLAPSPRSVTLSCRIRRPQHLQKLFTSPPSSQKPRDLSTNRARLPAAWRPRTRPGLRAGPPPRGAALAPRKAGLDLLACTQGRLPSRASP
ncbi:hypothetical protein AAY473_003881 [Plecturocebus cupreus]